MKPTVDILIPTYNESAQILSSLEKLTKYCKENLAGYDYQIIVGDNGSTDSTYDLVAQKYSHDRTVKATKIPEKGRGHAIMDTWGNSKADICAYMDADLATDIKHTRDLIDSIQKGHYDIATGSRLLPQSNTKRSFRRQIVGLTNVALAKLILGTSVSDLYCGFKAASREAIDTVFPHIKSEKWVKNGNAWFWDIEFLVTAERLGLKICEIPVRWTDDPGSTTNIIKDAIDGIKGMLRLRSQKLQA